ncbi:MAG TPA: DASS family sodium-coupled anion symporter [Pyrinomonadaceae bacterium]|jgi:DASS family divalent anion:Na+ symporter|nr:DASS family sodium-coupled anion symporter [Pyrinomonadaceae bacterium]
MTETHHENTERYIWLRWLGVLACGLGIAFFPKPESVTQSSWTLLAIFIATIVGSILRPVPAGAIVLLGVAALAIFKALTIEKALQGFAEPVVWLVLAAFFLSRGMVKTGLGRRIALIFIKFLGKKTLGLGYALVLTDWLLASVVPSNGARNGGVILPIARSISETYDSKPGPSAQKLGAFLMLLLYQCDVIICATFLTGQASNAIIRSFAMENAGIQLTYLGWFVAAIVPSTISLIVIPQIVYRLCPPEIKHTPAAAQMATEELKKLGRITWREIVVSAVFITVVVLWMTADLTKLDINLIAIIGVCLLLLTNILTWKDLVTETAAWEVFIWYGGLVMMAKELGNTGITKLFAENTAAYTKGWQWWLALGVLALVYFYSHYAFASITAHVTAMYIPFLIVCISVGAPAGLTVLVLAYISNLNASLTHFGTTSAPIYFGAGYVRQRPWWSIGLLASFANIIIWTGTGLIWWKILGWW